MTPLLGTGDKWTIAAIELAVSVVGESCRAGLRSSSRRTRSGTTRTRPLLPAERRSRSIRSRPIRSSLAGAIGWYSLTWCREGGAWKLALWTWQRAGGARDSWNDTFRGKIGFNKEPNGLLVDTIAGVRTGAPLDIAMGEGRNALYLASRGWKVTGVDFSDEGLRVAREGAAARHLTLDLVNADLDVCDFGVAKWDLVTMIYATQNARWVERARKSLKPGGLFVLEDFHEDKRDDGGFPAGQLAAIFKDGFEVLRDDVHETTPDWASDKATIERFVARRR